MLDDECNQNFYPLTNYEIRNQYDKGFTRKTFQSVEISSQSLSKNLQGDKDENEISLSWHGGHPEQLYSCLD